MDTSISLRVNDNSRQWGGNHSPQGERQNRRKQKLEALLQSIHVGDLEAARQAFIALVNFDLSVSTDPYLTKIGKIYSEIAKQKINISMLFSFSNTIIITK